MEKTESVSCTKECRIVDWDESPSTECLWEQSVQEVKADLVIHTPSKPQEYYYIKNDNYVLSLSGDIHRPDQQLSGCHVVVNSKLTDISIADSQMWYLEDAGDGYCYIVSKQNGLVLDISGADWKEKAHLIIWPKNTPPTVIANQKWKIDRHVQKGIITSQLNGQVMEVQKIKTNGSPVIMRRRRGVFTGGVTQQLWEFEPAI